MSLAPILITAIEADLKLIKHFRGYYPNSTEAYHSYLPFSPTYGSETFRIATSHLSYADPVRRLLHARLTHLKHKYGRNWDSDTSGEKEEFPHQGKCKHGLAMAWDEDSELNGDDCARCGRYREEIWYLRRLDERICCWIVQVEEERVERSELWLEGAAARGGWAGWSASRY